tara:strand:+ start:1595 stop:1846 length:252 start_codon:yes stop_codon:yes gene_type:complete
MILCLSNFHKKISEVLNKPDQGLLAARYAASLHEQLAEKDKEIHVLYFTLQEVCKYAFMVEGTLESSHPESWIKKTEEKYFKL